jgi:hypothetical protein
MESLALGHDCARCELVLVAFPPQRPHPIFLVRPHFSPVWKPTSAKVQLQVHLEICAPLAGLSQGSGAGIQLVSLWTPNGCTLGSVQNSGDARVLLRREKNAGDGFHPSNAIGSPPESDSCTADDFNSAVRVLQGGEHYS